MRFLPFVTIVLFCSLTTPSVASESLASESLASENAWEELFGLVVEDAEARVEMETRSFKKRLVPGETIINAHLRLFYREGGTTTEATGDYEVYCAARQVFRSNLEMRSQDAAQTQTQITVLHKTLLEGQEHHDFIGIMDILCARQ
jgi:hypothetical protein